MMSRCSLIVLAVALLSTAAARAQFIADCRIPGPARPSPAPRFAPLRIESHRVEVLALDGAATTTVNLSFRNPNGVDLEGTFMFPLPDDAAVAGFSMMMGGKKVAGEVLEREQAQSIYRGIVERQKDPALLEYVGRRLFQAKVYPIPASGTSEIELVYQETLRRDQRTIEYRYPLRTRGVTQAPVGKLAFRLSIRSKDPVLTVYSPSHEVDIVKKGDHEAVVSYEKGQEEGDRDLAVAYGLSKDAVGATLFSHVEAQGDGSFVLLLAPSSESQTEVLAKDVVFVVDTSGSMAGEKMDQTKAALSYCVKTLSEKDRFNIVSFATDAQPLFQGLVTPDADNRKHALEHIRDRMIARGGTNINDALTAALAMSKDADRPFLVIFMTDGQPTIGTTATDSILANVKAANKAMTRLFVFGVGEDLKVDLLDLLAEQNRGARDYVGSKESIETRISSFFEKVSSPVISDLSVEVTGVRVRDLLPKTLPDLFRGSQLLVAGKFEGVGPAVVRLKGKANGKTVEHVFELTFGKGSDATTFVPRLYAVRRVGYLMDQIRLNGENKEVKDEIVRLGKTYGIVTPYTSYLVVEDVVADTRPARRGGRGFEGGRRDSKNPPPSGAAPGAGGGVEGSEHNEGWGESPTDENAAIGLGGTRGKPREARDAQGADGKGKDGASGRFLRRLADEAKSDSEEARKALPVGAPAPSTKPGHAPEPATPAPGIIGGSPEGERNTRTWTDASPIELSKAVRELREARSEDGQVGGALVRRVGERTFYLRHGLTVESPILDLDAAVIEKRLVRIEAFSKEYFDLLAARPTLAKVLAISDRILFVDGEKLYLVVPKKPAGS